MPRRHVLMLVLAIEVLWLGAYGAARFRQPAAATINLPSNDKHVVT